MTVIEGVNVFLNVVGGHRYIRVFKLTVYLSTRAYLIVLFRHLYICNLLLLEGPSCLIVTAFYRVSIEFLFGLLQNFKGGIVNVNK